MVTKVYRVTCEWDIGLEYVVYRSREKALAAAEAALEDSGIDDPFHELLAAGLVGIQHLTLE